MDEKEKNARREEDVLNAGIAGASSETIQRFGAAAKEHYVAYSGKDNETNKRLAKGLKDISKQKVNPDYKYQSIHQQAGFSAEVKDAANVNAERIISGEKNRKIRTDDLGKVNHPLFDHVEIDADGNIIEGSGSQMKFVGASSNDPTGEGAPRRALNKLQSKKFEKYLDNNAKIDVPSDYYEKMQEEAQEQIKSLNKQLQRLMADGKKEQAENVQRQIAKLEKIKSSLRKSTVSSEEAVFARLHPKLSTVKSVTSISHRAGVETAESAMVIGGSVSVVKNIVAVIKGEEDPEDAVKTIAKDTASSAIMGYGTGFAGTAVKGAMQNAGSENIRVLANTNLSGTLVAVSVAATKTLKRYFNGEIDGVECFEELGEQGTGMLSSAMFATIGQAAIPIPVVGGMIGGMIGYAVSSACYSLLLNSLKEAKLAHERRLEIEKICEEHIKLIQEYRKEMEVNIKNYLSESEQIFHSAFADMKDAIRIGNVDGFIAGANSITEALGKDVPYSDIGEFDAIMKSDMPFKL